MIVVQSMTISVCVFDKSKFVFKFYVMRNHILRNIHL